MIKGRFVRCSVLHSLLSHLYPGSAGLAEAEMEQEKLYC